MQRVAVIARSGKQLGDGLGALRERLRDRGVDDPLWFEFAKGRQAPGCVQEAISKGATSILAWGGDGTVQRAIDALVGHDVELGILPAGTANVLANALGIPIDLDEALDVALFGRTRVIDTGTLNGEHFAVMAGAGLDALIMGQAERDLKGRFGRIAYLWSGARSLDTDPVKARISLDGRPMYSGPVTCVLVGNVGELMGKLEVFPGAMVDDGLLELGIVSAKSRLDWVRTLGRAAAGRAEKSPFVMTARGRRVDARFSTPLAFEIDGGARGKTKALKVRMHHASVTVRVPPAIDPPSP